MDKCFTQKAWGERVGGVAFVQWTVAAFCCLGFFTFLGSYPRFINFDFAAEGVFINEVANGNVFHGRFVQATGAMAGYWQAFQNSRLCYSFLIAPLVVAFQIPALSIDKFLRVIAGVFCLAGVFSAVSLVSNQKAQKYKILIFALSISLPPFVLMSRSGASYNMFSFFLFWALLSALYRYTAKGQPKYLYLCALVSAICLANIYFVYIFVPVVAVLWLTVTKKWKFLFASRHLYMGAALFALLAWFIFQFLAWKKDVAVSQAIIQILDFFHYRGFTFSSARLEIPFTEKLQKLVNQLVTFKSDSYGDQTVRDREWTLGAFHWMYTAMLPFALWGVGLTFKRKENDGLFFFVVLVVAICLLCSFSFPEGRYLIVVWPCIAYFIIRGLAECFDSDLLIGALITGVASITAYLIVAVHAPYVDWLYRDLPSIEAFAQHLPTTPVNREIYAFHPGRYGRIEWPYYSLVTEQKVKRISWGEMVAAAESSKDQDKARPMLVCVGKANSRGLLRCRDNGFRELNRYTVKGFNGQVHEEIILSRE